MVGTVLLRGWRDTSALCNKSASALLYEYSIGKQWDKLCLSTFYGLQTGDAHDGWVTGCACLCCSNTGTEAHDAIVEKYWKSRTVLILVEFFVAVLFIELCVVMNILSSNYEKCGMSRTIPWQYHCFYLKRVYRSNLKIQKSIRNGM